MRLTHKGRGAVLLLICLFGAMGIGAIIGGLRGIGVGWIAGFMLWAFAFIVMNWDDTNG